MKVSHGHAKTLMGKTNYLFCLRSSTWHARAFGEGYYCPMVQSSSFMIRAALGLPGSTLLNPSLNLKFDPEMLALDLHKQLVGKLGWKRGLVKAAFQYALQKQEQFEKELHRRGREFLMTLPPDEPWWWSQGGLQPSR